MHFLISVAVFAEILWVVLGFYAYFRKRTDLNSEALAYALLSMFAVFSVSLQAFFFLGIHEYHYLCDVFLVSAATVSVHRHTDALAQGFTGLRLFCGRNPIFSIFLPALASIQFAKGFLLPPVTYDSLTYHLTRVMMMKSEGQLFLDNFSDYRLDLMPVAYDILHFLFLRFHTDYGLGSFGFLSYVLVAVAVYALVQRLWENDELAKTVTLVAASMTIFVMHAASTKNDLVLGGVTAVAFLAAYNFYRSKKLADLHVLGIALAFGATAKFTFCYLGLIFLLFYLVVLLRNWGAAETGRQMIRFYRYRGGILLVTPLTLAATLIVILVHNIETYGYYLGPDFYLPSFAAVDGWRGGALNVVRFVIHMMNIPAEIFGYSLTELHKVILGDNYSLGVLWWPDYPVVLETLFFPPEEAAWFGFLSFPLLLALVYGAWKGDGFIRAAALASLVTIVFLAMSTSWTPWRGRYYAGPIIAALVGLGFWLQRLGIDRPKVAVLCQRGIMTIAGAQLLYLTTGGIATEYSELEARFTQREYAYASILGGRENWRQFVEDTPHGARVLLISGTGAALFPLYLRRGDLKFTPAGVFEHYFREPLKLDGVTYTIGEKEDFGRIADKFDRLMMVHVSDEFRAYAYEAMAELRATKKSE